MLADTAGTRRPANRSGMTEFFKIPSSCDDQPGPRWGRSIKNLVVVLRVTNFDAPRFVLRPFMNRDRFGQTSAGLSADSLLVLTRLAITH